MEDFLKAKVARETAKKYADIIHRERPAIEESLCKHPRMPLENRAKIFSPFAALRGYEQKIAAEGVKMQRVERQYKSEEETERISEKLSRVTKGQRLTIIYFEEDGDDTGFYREKLGKVKYFDLLGQTIEVGETTISFSDIWDIIFETDGRNCV